MSTSIASEPQVARPVVAGLLLGVGLGGFVDGIVLHQMLQWHHMLSSEGSFPVTTVAGLEANTLADGLFHLATLIATLLGVVLLSRTARTGARTPAGLLPGLILAGWGTFNLVEGTIDHHILGVHHVRAASVDGRWAYDLGFLLLGALLLTGGLAWARRSDGTSPEQVRT